MVFSSLWSIRPIAYAGVLSSFFDLFSRSEAAGLPESSDNSQNMALLHAALNTDPAGARGGTEIPVDGNALSPSVGPAGSAGDISDKKTSSDQISIYIVSEGDTLGSIAALFDVSVNTIRWANDISRGQSIHVGDRLTILPVDGVEYTVKKGDTLAGIAKKFKADSGEIADFNNLNSDEPLTALDEIIIPDGILETPVPVSSRGPALAARAGGPAIPGYFINPLPGGRKTQGLHGKNGIDLASYYGASVVAAAPGTVIVARGSGWNGGYGFMVVIEHPNGTQTLYAHLSSVLVTVGQVVSQGEIIGREGRTGKATGPHLHFEVRGAVNPGVNGSWATN